MPTKIVCDSNTYQDNVPVLRARVLGLANRCYQSLAYTSSWTRWLATLLLACIFLVYGMLGAPAARWGPMASVLGRYDDSETPTMEAMTTADIIRTTEPPLPVTCSRAERLKWVREICAQRHWANPNLIIRELMPQSFLVDDVHRVVFCSNIKVGSSSFKGLMEACLTNVSMTQLEQQVTDHYTVRELHSEGSLKKAGLRWLEKLSATEQDVAMKTYYKFTAVRHPLDRLLSAYRDRIITHQKYGVFHLLDRHRHVIEQTLGARRNEYAGHNFMPSFEQFLRLVVTGYNSWFFDGHWGNYIDRCRPCEVQYDSIVRLETLQEDIPEILQHFLDADGEPYTFPNFNTNRSKADGDTPDMLTPALEALDPAILERVMTLYKRDFDIFGYQLNRTDKAVSCMYNDIGNSTTQQLRQCC